MKRYLDRVRSVSKTIPIGKSIMNSTGILVLGLIVGVIIKLLDIYTSNLGNIFSQISVWILLGTVISIYSSTPIRAGINSFVFCIGMLATYYFTAELFESTYSWVFIYGWIAFSISTPLFGYIAWYSKGRGWVAKVITVGIICVMLVASIILFGKISFTDVVFSFIALILLSVENPAKRTKPNNCKSKK